MAARRPAPRGESLLSHEELAAARADIEKSIGGQVAWGSDERLKLVLLPLGIPTLDAVLDGGLAFDRVTVLYGEESAGKTLLAMLAMKAAQAQGISVAFVDVEKTWVPAWASAVGVDPERVLVVRPRTAEEAWRAALALVRRRVGVVVVDSLAAMAAAEELEGEEKEAFETARVGGTAKLIGMGLRDVMAENTGSLVILINQLRQKVGVVYGNPEVLPGGKAQNYWAWQKVRVRRGKLIEEGTGDNKRVLGYNLVLKVEKNKQGAPFKSAEVPFYYTGKIDEMAALVGQAIDAGVFSEKPPKYRVVTDDGEIIDLFGRNNVLERARSDPEFEALLRARLRPDELEL